MANNLSLVYKKTKLGFQFFEAILKFRNTEFHVLSFKTAARTEEWLEEMLCDSFLGEIVICYDEKALIDLVEHVSSLTTDLIIDYDKLF